MSTTHDEIDQQIEHCVRLLAATRRIGGFEGVHEGDSIDARGERDTTSAASPAKGHYLTGKVGAVGMEREDGAHVANGIQGEQRVERWDDGRHFVATDQGQEQEKGPLFSVLLPFLMTV
jgi:hypothetical protein